MPYFFARKTMATPKSPRLSNIQLIALILLALVVVCVLSVLVYLAYTLRTPAGVAQPTAAMTFALPTAVSPTATIGPPMPAAIRYTAIEPLHGFGNCTQFGAKGTVTASNGQRLQGVQIVLWSRQEGLLALGKTDQNGGYTILADGAPAQRQLWVQVFENDVPVSRPVTVNTQINCDTGFQVYQIDWQRIEN
jgi:hypothetical protein